MRQGNAKDPGGNGFPPGFFCCPDESARALSMAMHGAAAARRGAPL